MKKIGLVIMGLFCLVVIGIVFVLGYLGYIPFLSHLLGSDKPRDLGITYTEQDFKSARTKSKLEYGTLPANTPMESSIVRTGTRKVTASWNSAEVTSLMNNRPYKYWPIKDVQLKINDDGTTEMSGVVVKDKLVGYAAAIGVPSEVTDTVTKFLPQDPTFYLKAKTSLENNQVKDFDVQAVTLGKMPLPVNTLLSGLLTDTVNGVYAADVVEELSKYEGKRAAIINFINNRLSQITGFFAKKANFQNGKLNFDGTLSEKESTVR